MSKGDAWIALFIAIAGATSLAAMISAVQSKDDKSSVSSFIATCCCVLALLIILFADAMKINP